MTWRALHIDPHGPTDELNVWAQGPERPKDSGHGDRRMIEAFAKHLDLHNAVKGTVAERSQNLVLLVPWLCTMNLAHA